LAAYDPLLVKRKKRQPIGHRVEYYLCLDCWERVDDLARPYLERGGEEIREGDDAGVPYECHKCGAALRPRVHA
jgi:DNA-directed RNA polymerase subunit RPC12/RpoP